MKINNAFKLLHHWETPPGILPDGSYDVNKLKEWLKKVESICKESGHYRIALDQVGKVLAHTPPDPSGLWIHKGAAEVLDTKEYDMMREAFRCELFNQRGVHTWTAGKEEKKYAKNYHQKADALDHEGFFNLAATIRGLAKSYEREAAKEADSDPHDIF